MEKLLLGLRPEPGHPTSLWAAVVPYPRSGPRFVTFPDELGLSTQLIQRLSRWTEQWRRNYLGREDRPFGKPQWQRDGDVPGWIREGTAIEESLALELPDYEIHDQWRHYAHRFILVEVGPGEG